MATRTVDRNESLINPYLNNVNRSTPSQLKTTMHEAADAMRRDAQKKATQAEETRVNAQAMSALGGSSAAQVPQMLRDAAQLEEDSIALTQAAGAFDTKANAIKLPA